MNIIGLNNSFNKLGSLLRAMSVDIEKTPKQVLNVHLQNIQLICANTRAQYLAHDLDANEIIVDDILNNINIYIINIFISESKISLEQVIQIFNMVSRYYKLRDGFGEDVVCV